jgi:LmbE family N-acetylglucosaminyl deacetylase
MTRTRGAPSGTVAGYMSTTVLSPHPDDAVLSLWHVLAGPGEVTVVNVFAGEPAGAKLGWWDALSGARDPQSRMAERWEEDREALALCGREPTNLGFVDWQYRRGEQELGPLADAIEAAAPAGLLLAPSDAGGEHPDHTLVREAALLLRDRGREVALYADLPHATRKGVPHWEPLSLNGRGETEPPEVHDLSTAEAARKREALERYRTQYPPLDERFSLSSKPELLRSEVTWRVPAA